MFRSFCGLDFLWSGRKQIEKSLIWRGSQQNVFMSCWVANSMETKFWLDKISMVITLLRAPRIDRASAKSSLFKRRLCSFRKIFCIGRIEAATVFTNFVMFFQGSYRWLNPRSSLLLVCMLSFVPSHTACPDMLTNVVFLPNNW